jgi:RTX calcium-binding nonapeptide repeat (4 copies)
MSRRTTVGAGISLGAIVAVPATAQADDLTVTNLNDSGPGSLRQALIDASDNDPDADRILFKSRLSGTIELTLGDPLYIYQGDLDIIGPGARKLTVDGNGTSKVFGVYSSINSINATISGLTIRGGNGEGYIDELGGGVLNYGAGANLTLKQVRITGNTAAEDGGGVRNYDGDLTIKDSTISGNTAAGDFGGGGIYSEGTGATATIINSTISGNAATGVGDPGDGGGVYIGSNGGSAVIRHSTIVGNAGDNYGGGLYAAGPLDLVGTVVANNQADDAGNDVYDAASPGVLDFAFNLVEDPDTGADPITGPGNILGQDPNLKPLRNNGGPTDTHAFKKSPVKNKVPKNQSEKKDQRGAKRKGKGDIGAYELVKCEGVIVNRVGTGKKDKLKGTKRKDGILGLGGNDKLSGKKGADGLCGGKGKDKLKGGPGKDKLDGGPGKDQEIQ